MGCKGVYITQTCKHDGGISYVDFHCLVLVSILKIANNKLGPVAKQACLCLRLRNEIIFHAPLN